MDAKKKQGFDTRGGGRVEALCTFPWVPIPCLYVWKPKKNKKALRKEGGGGSGIRSKRYGFLWGSTYIGTRPTSGQHTYTTTSQPFGRGNICGPKGIVEILRLVQRHRRIVVPMKHMDLGQCACGTMATKTSRPRQSPAALPHSAHEQKWDPLSMSR